MKFVLMSNNEINIVASMCGIKKMYGFNNHNSKDIMINTHYNVFYMVKKGLLYFYENNDEYKLSVREDIVQIFSIVAKASRVVKIYNDNIELCIYYYKGKVAVIMHNNVYKMKYGIRLMKIDELIKYMLNENIIYGAVSDIYYNNKIYDYYMTNFRKNIDDKININDMVIDATMEAINIDTGSVKETLILGWYKGRNILAYCKDIQNGCYLNTIAFCSSFIKLFLEEENWNLRGIQ